MFQQIMVPLDTSPRAELALPLAAQIARASGGSILLLQVVSPLIDFSGGLSPAPLMTEQVIESDLAEGNTYLNELRANKPMLHIPRTDATRPLRALVPLDGSPLAEAALIPAANLVTALASPAPGALHLIQVVKHLSPTGDEGFTALLNKEAMEHAKTYLASVKERTKEMLKDLKLSITWSITNDSDVADAIIGTAEHGQQQEETEGASGCDLIAMSTHGRGGWERLVMGSVTERVLSATRLPLLVVRPRQTGTTKS